MPFRYLGANVRRIRLERCLSQAALGVRLSPTKQQTEVSDIELGRLPRAEAEVRKLVTQFALALDVPENVLLARRRQLRRPTCAADSFTEVASS